MNAEPGFVLHERLQRDCHVIGEAVLSRVLLLDDARYPWVILVPRRQAIREWHQLNSDDQLLLHKECMTVSTAMQTLFRPHKLNIGALGNLVPQLHLHLIARYDYDPAWPGPVWGHSEAQPYGEAGLIARMDEIREALKTVHEFGFQ